jgi:hypothetical protein
MNGYVHHLLELYNNVFQSSLFNEFVNYQNTYVLYVRIYVFCTIHLLQSLQMELCLDAVIGLLT